jgi:hypothetical protein
MEYLKFHSYVWGTEFLFQLNYFKLRPCAWWHIPVIPIPQEAEIGRIEVQDQPKQKS